MYCRNLPIIKNKLLNKFAPKIASMKKSYYHLAAMAFFALGMILATKYGLRSIGFGFLILSFVGLFFTDSLNEVIENDKLTESYVWVSRMNCLLSIRISMIPPVVIVGLIMEIMK